MLNMWMEWLQFRSKYFKFFVQPHQLIYEISMTLILKADASELTLFRWCLLYNIIHQQAITFLVSELCKKAALDAAVGCCNSDLCEIVHSDYSSRWSCSSAICFSRGCTLASAAKVRGTLHVKLSGEVMLDKHSTMRDDDILFPFECFSSIYRAESPKGTIVRTNPVNGYWYPIQYTLWTCPLLIPKC